MRLDRACAAVLVACVLVLAAGPGADAAAGIAARTKGERGWRAITGYLSETYWSRMEFYFMAFPSWKHITEERPDLKVDLLVFGHPVLGHVLANDCKLLDLRIRDNLEDFSDIHEPQSQCIYIPMEDARMVKQYDFPFMNNIQYFVEPASLAFLQSYEKLVKSDFDVFWSPSFMDYWPERFVFGQQMYVVVEETKHKLKQAAAALNMTYKDVHNMGATWYGDVDSMRALTESSIKVLDYILVNMWPQRPTGGPSTDWRTGEGWPEWSAGIAALYAAELAANDLNLEFEVDDRMDSWSDKQAPVADVIAIHTQHGATNFDKFKFFAHQYEKLDMDLLDTTQIPEYCAYIAVTAHRNRREGWCMPHTEEAMESRPDHDSTLWNKELTRRNKREGRLTPKEAAAAAREAQKVEARSRAIAQFQAMSRSPALAKARAVVTYLPLDEALFKEFISYTWASWRATVADALPGQKFDLIVFGAEGIELDFEDIDVEYATVDLGSRNPLEEVDPSISQLLIATYKGKSKSREELEPIRMLMDEAALEFLYNYPLVFKTQPAVFFTPAFAGFEPEPGQVVLGRETVHYSPRTADSIESVRLDLEMQRSDDEEGKRINLGPSWYGDVNTLAQLAATTAEVAEHLFENEFSGADVTTPEGWPQWARHMALLYATEVAAHHSGIDFVVDPRIDAPSDSAAPVDVVMHVLFRASSRFSRVEFMKTPVPNMSRELEELLDSLDETVVRDFCVITATRVRAALMPNHGHPGAALGGS